MNSLVSNLSLGYVWRIVVLMVVLISSWSLLTGMASAYDTVVAADSQLASVPTQAPGSPGSNATVDEQGGFITCSKGGDCDFCDVAATFARIINWLVLVLTLVGVLMFVYAGYRLTASQGNPGELKKAKDIILSVIIGFVLVMSAWMIIGIILKAFIGGNLSVWEPISSQCGEQYQGGGATNQIQGTDENPTTEIPFIETQSYNYAPQPAPGQAGSVYGNEGPESIYQGSSGSQITPRSSTGAVSFAFSGNLLPQQQGHLATPLAQFQRCIAENAPSGQYIITSVSDNWIANGSRTWQSCASQGCQHTVNSCHYGGRSCVGQSYALDIATSNTSNEQEAGFMAAARACGGYAQHEGNHMHISIGAAAGCGCN